MYGVRRFLHDSCRNNQLASQKEITVNRLVKYSKADWIRDGIDMGVIIRHEDTPELFAKKIASSQSTFVNLCDKHQIDPDELLENHRRRLILANTKTAKAILRRRGVKIGQDEAQTLVEAALILEKTAFIGSLRNIIPNLGAFNLGRVLKWGTGLGLLSGIIYYLGKAGFLGKPKEVSPEMLEKARAAGVSNPEKVMPWAASISNDPAKQNAIKKMQEVMCKKSGRCADQGTMNKLMNLLKNEKGEISGWASAGAAAGTIPLAAGLVGGVGKAVSDLVKGPKNA